MQLFFCSFLIWNILVKPMLLAECKCTCILVLFYYRDISQEAGHGIIKNHGWTGPLTVRASNWPCKWSHQGNNVHLFAIVFFLSRNGTISSVCKKLQPQTNLIVENTVHQLHRPLSTARSGKLVSLFSSKQKYESKLVTESFQFSIYRQLTFLTRK